MNTFLDSLPEKRFILLYLLVIILSFLLQSWQGFDMCDEGWVLTGYQQIFNDPASVEYLFLYYSSQLLGGVWNSIFGSGGILSFRILSVLILTFSFYVVYCLLRKQISRADFLLSFIMIYFTWDSGLMVFHHNYMTILLYCIISLILYKAVCEVNWMYMLIAGVFLGIEVFARIPNLTLLAFLIVLIPFSQVHSYKEGFGFLGLFLVGLGIGSGVILLLMCILGHLDIFERSIISGLFAADSSDSTHNLSRMLHVYIGNYYSVVKSMLMIFAPSCLYIHFFKNKLTDIRKRIFWNSLFLIISIASILISIIKFTLIFNVYAFATGWILYGLYKYKNESDKIYLLLISLVTLYCLPLGSDLGIGNMGSSCILIAVPLSIYICRTKLHLWNMSIIKCSLVLGIILLCVIGTKNILSQCYFDKGWRWEKTYRINSRLATTFTTKENKKIVDGLLQELNKYIEKNDRVLIFQTTPMLHFLTETRPYLGNPWPWTYDSQNLENQLEYARNIHSELPVIVREKGTVGKWQIHYNDWDNPIAKETYMHKNRRILAIRNFIRDNKYSVAWENDLFQILIPPHPEKEEALVLKR